MDGPSDDQLEQLLKQPAPEDPVPKLKHALEQLRNSGSDAEARRSALVAALRRKKKP